MKKKLFFLLLILVALPIAVFALQDGVLRVEITGVDASGLPAAVITANVYDSVGQPLTGLTATEFALTGALASFGQIVSVENLADDNLPFSTVLVLDVSSSMAGQNPATSPIELAKAAARIYVEGVRENDPVAIVTFGSTVNVIQQYTTDKATLLAVIDAINYGGETALYQAGFDAVRLADEAPTARRVVVLLSDGAEFGGSSQVGRNAAIEEALTRGVPVYTIGLGFGTDRSYLEQLSGSTNARFYESPNGDELATIYAELARLLRSQYVITVNADVPLDGTEYEFGIRATSPQGSGEAFATLRAPVPVPVVRLTNLTAEALIAPFTLTAEVVGDQAIAGVGFIVGDQPAVNLTEPPYSVTLDPALLPPGPLPLTVAATDADGDTGTLEATVTIGALAPVVAFDPDPTTISPIMAPVTVNFTVTGQSPAADATLTIDGGEPITLTEPFSFTIDPLTFTPGDHFFNLVIRNTGGGEAIAPLTLTIGAVPPTVTITGLEPDQIVSEALTFGAFATGQGEISTISATANGVPLAIDSAGLIALDPAALAPGAVEVVVTAVDSNGTSGSASVTIGIDALPPSVTITGLTEGEMISADTRVTVTAVSQTPVTTVSADVDGAPLMTDDSGAFVIPVLDFTPGGHVLTASVTNEAGQTGTFSVSFAVDSAPGINATATIDAMLTATQQAVNATASAVAIQATGTQQAIEIAATQVAFEATGTQVAVAATASQVAFDEAGTQQAVAAATQAALDAQSTQSALDAAATDSAVATESFIATATQSAVDATATQAALDAQSTSAAEATGTAVVVAATDSAIATATEAANATATQDAIDAAATRSVEMTATAVSALATDAAAAAATQAADATATAIAATATQSAALDATATIDQGMADMLAAAQVATRDTLATSNAAARAVSQMTQDARSTRNAQETAAAARAITATAAAAVTQAAQATQAILDATASAVAQATFDTQQLESAQAEQAATATQIIIDATATAAAEQQRIADATATQIAQDIATETAQAITDATGTAVQLGVNATGTAESAGATRTAVIAAEQAATQAVIEATQLQNDLFLTATQIIRDATATTRAETFGTSEAATVSARETAIATPEGPDAVAQAASDTPATATPQGTLTPVSADGTPASGDSLPLVLVVIAILVILLLLFFALRGNRNRS